MPLIYVHFIRMPKHHENKNGTNVPEDANTHRSNVTGVTEIIHKCGISKRHTSLNHSCTLSQRTIQSENGSLVEQTIPGENEVEERVSVRQCEDRAESTMVEMSSIEATLDNFWLQIKKCALAEIQELLQKMNQELQKEIHTVKKKYENEFQKYVSEQERLLHVLSDRDDDVRRKESVIEHLLEILKQNQDKAILKDAMIQWHKNTIKKKYECIQDKIARTHYENRTKQKAFNSWSRFLKENWHVTKQKYQEQYDDQQAIIQQQQEKIKELTAELERTKKKLNLLKGKTNEQQESMRRSLLRGVCALNMETMNLLSSSDLTKCLSSKNSLDPIVEQLVENKKAYAELKSASSESKLLDVWQTNHSLEDVQKNAHQSSAHARSGQIVEKNTKASVPKETNNPNSHNMKKIRVHNYYCERFPK